MMMDISAPTLQEEVKRLKDQNVIVGMFINGGDGTQVVRMSLDTDFLNKFTAKQWGIIPKKPVIVQVFFFILFLYFFFVINFILFAFIFL